MHKTSTFIQLSKSITGLVLIVTINGCGVDDIESTTKSLAADTTAKNVAVLFTGDASGIPGVHQDPPNITRTLKDPTLGLNFLVNTYRNQTQQDITTNSGNVAGRMASESPNGTMFWYFSGHGSQDGTLAATDGSFRFEAVAARMRQARSDVAFKRLIILIDACFAGNSVDGATAITANSGSGIGGGGGFSNNPFSSLFALNGRANNLGSIVVAPPPNATYIDQAQNFRDQTVQGIMDASQPLRGKLYEQMIIIASSRSTETSGDTSTGGVGTTAFLTALRQLSSNPNSTIGQLLEGTRRNASGQTPVFRTDPPNLANELIFGTSMPMTTPTAVPTAAVPTMPPATPLPQ